MDLRRENDVEQLRRVALTQQVQIEQLLKVLSAQSRRLDQLTGSDGELQHSLSLLEQLQRENAPSTDSAPASSRSSDDTSPKERTKRRRSGPTPQPNLPLVPELYTLDEADQTCPACGDVLSPMKGQFETSQMVDLIEVAYRLVEVRQQKYTCRCGGCVETAPGPERATPGGRYSLPFAVKVAVDKYLDHLPLARQSRILARHGVEVKSQTLWDQIHVVAQRLRPAYDALFSRLLQRDVIGLDQTSWKRLETKGHKPWQMWCLTSEDTVFHSIRDDKGAETFADLVGDFEGVIVCDALATHAAGARDRPGISLAGCWAHVFRKFSEASADHPEALMAMEWIGQLYAIDERATDRASRAELRRTESAAVLETFKTWLWGQATLKTLSIGDAARYTIKFWDRHTRFVHNPDIPLDNNQTERGIRGPVVGRKNHYGSKSRRGTEVAAIFYTLIETAKLNRINPAVYLLDAARAANLGDILLPLPKQGHTYVNSG